jgi:serine/threonine protein kinase
MAEIYRAHVVGAAGFEREVAIKRIRGEFARDPRFVKMFIREASLAARLSHPNIVSVFDFDKTTDEQGRETYYIAMELVRGWDLRTIELEAQKHDRRLPLDVGLGIMIDVLDGLAHAHGLQDEHGSPLGLIHRDVSPHNVLVSPLGHIKLGDFGIARAMFEAGATQSGTHKGKLLYMSPEQVQAQPLDARTDIFSAGVMLYELLAGYRPFDADNDYKVMKKILGGELPPMPAEVPGPLGAIVKKALATAPGGRYPSTGQLRDALRTFCDHHALDTSKVARSHYLTRLFGARAEALLRAPAVRPDSDVGESAATDDATHRREPLESPRNEPPRSASASAALAGLGVALTRGWRRYVLAAAALAVLSSAALVGRRVYVRLTKRPFRFLVYAWPEQDTWMRDRVVTPALEGTPFRAELTNYQGDTSLFERQIQGRADAAEAPDLLMVPLWYGRALVEARYVRSLLGVAPEATEQALATIEAETIPSAIGACRYTTIKGSHLYYVPYRMEERYLFYRPSKVATAARHWSAYRNEIESDLRVMGFDGLPSDYELEPDPRSWDLFDVLVAGYTWMRESPGEAGRVPRRSYHYYGTVAELLDLAVAMGAKTDDLLEASQPMVDALEWDMVRRRLGLYHPSAVDAERGASISTVIEAFVKGEVYLATLSPRHLTAILQGGGGGTRAAASLKDLDVAPMPRGVSLRLDALGHPVREGSRRSLTEGWLLAVPSTSRAPEVAWRVMTSLLSKKNHEEEMARFPNLPVRKDVVSFPSTLLRRLYVASLAQHADGSVVYVPRFSRLEEWNRYYEKLLGAWAALVQSPLGITRPPKTLVDPGGVLLSLQRTFSPR